LGTWIAAGSAPHPLTSQHSSNTLKPTSPCLVSQRTAIRLRASNASAAVTTDKGTISSPPPTPIPPFSPSTEISSDLSVDLESVYVAHHFICIAPPTLDWVSHAHSSHQTGGGESLRSVTGIIVLSFSIIWLRRENSLFHHTSASQR
jgi:hypothetical protein